MSVRWGPGRFLVEVSGESGERGSVYVACGGEDGGAGDGEVLVSPHGLTLRLQGRRLASPRWAAFRLLPDTLRAFQWAQGQSLFTASVTAALDQPYLSSKDAFVLSRLIRGSQSLDAFTTQLNKEGGEVICSHCQEHLIPTTEGLGVARSLPSDDWISRGAGVDLSFFCCQGREEKTENKSNGDLGTNVLVGDSSLYVVWESELEGLSVEEAGESSVLRCLHCEAQLGRIAGDTPGESSSPPEGEEESGSDVSPSALSPSRRRLLRLSHSAAWLRVRGGHPHFLTSRFGSEEKYLAWLVLSKCHETSSRKIVLKTLDGRPKILLWVVEWPAVTASGVLSESGDSETLQPLLCLKVLFRLIEDGQTESEWEEAGSAMEPEASVGRLTRSLLEAAQSLPPPLRTLGRFNLAYLPLANLEQLNLSSTPSMPPPSL